ncbi:MAG: sodium:solute symporter family transporter, partial [Gemmatimonadota bacterium]
LIAAGVKMLMPFLVIVPGMIALVLGGGEGATAYGGIGQGIIPARRAADGTAMVDAVGRTILDFDMATPMMLVTLFPNGVLGLGFTALIAACMAAMAANLTAFGAVWTYDVYQARVGEVANDERCLWMGRVAMVGGSVLSVAAAFAASAFDSILEFLQLGVAFVVAPLAATMALGVFWRRATGHGAFAGNLAGMLAAVIHHGISLPRGAAPGIRGGFLVPRLGYPSELAQGFSTAIVAFAACFFVTIIVSFLTRPRAEEEMSGLVYALTPKAAEQHLTWAQRPMTLAIAVLAVTVWLNVVFY